MNQNLIFAPMGAVALLTFTVLALIPLRRFRAAFAGTVVAEDFRFGESATVPPGVLIPNRNYMNLLELTTLYFPACLMFYVTGRVDAVVLATGLGLKNRTHIERLVREKQPVTADTALRLARMFGTTPQFWINLQTTHDLSIAAMSVKDDLAAIKPLAAA